MHVLRFFVMCSHAPAAPPPSMLSVRRSHSPVQHAAACIVVPAHSAASGRPVRRLQHPAPTPTSASLMLQKCVQMYNAGVPRRAGQGVNTQYSGMCTLPARATTQEHSERDTHSVRASILCCVNPAMVASALRRRARCCSSSRLERRCRHRSRPKAAASQRGSTPPPLL